MASIRRRPCWPCEIVSRMRRADAAINMIRQAMCGAAALRDRRRGEKEKGQRGESLPLRRMILRSDVQKQAVVATLGHYLATERMRLLLSAMAKDTFFSLLISNSLLQLMVFFSFPPRRGSRSPSLAFFSSSPSSSFSFFLCLFEWVGCLSLSLSLCGKNC